MAHKRHADFLQDAGFHDILLAAVIAPLALRQEAARTQQAARAAATKVDFFTLQTMRA